MAKAEAIELLKKYILLLNSNGISVYKAFLFGSYSTNTATEASDIDVMIVSEKYDETDDEAVGKIWKLTRMVSTKIEPFLIGKNKFISDDENYIMQCSWENVPDFDYLQLCLWISYVSLEDFINEFEWYFSPENSIMGNLQSQCCWINLSELFDQENDELEKYFPKQEELHEKYDYNNR